MKVRKLRKNQVFENIVWLFFDKAYGAILTLTFLSLFAKYIGPELFGIWNYIVAFGSILPALGSLGLNFVIVKSLKKHPNLNEKVLFHSFLIRTLSSVFFVILLLLLYYTLEINNEYFWVACLVFLSQIFFVANVFIQENEAHLENRKTVISRNIALSMGFLLRFIGITQEFNLLFFGMVNCIEYLTFFILNLWGSKLFVFHSPKKMQKRISYSLIKQGLPLLLSAVTVILYLRVDQLIIGYLLDNKNVGVYAAASRITEMFYAVPVIISNVFFPKIIEHFKDKTESKKIVDRMFGVVIWSTILVSLSIYLFSKPLILMLYGPEFIASAEILKIYSWSLILMGLLVTSSKYLLAINKASIIFKRDVTGLVFNIILNLILIPKFGIKGAAIATLISYSISAYFSNLCFKELRPLMKNQILSIYNLIKNNNDNIRIKKKLRE